MTRCLNIDLETYSDQDIMDVGAHRYVASPAFEILLFAYAFDDDPVEVIDLTDFGQVPRAVLEALDHPNIVKTAFNAPFERLCLAKHLGRPMPASHWSCTQVRSYYGGLPGSLGKVAKALHLEDQKDTEGKALIKYFCCPCKPTKVNGYRTRNLPHHAPEKWAKFIEYCRQDVVVERQIRKATAPIPPHEQRLWELDQLSNDAGITVDMVLVDNAVTLYDDYAARLTEEAKQLTGMENPNSNPQLKAWLEGRLGRGIDGVAKAVILELLETENDPVTRKMLEIRQELGKTSVKKYHMLQKAVCPDGKIRGVIQFYGANRTGRDAGRLLQVQNLVKNNMKQLNLARQMLLEGYLEGFEMLFGNVPDTLAQLIRTTLVPDPGQKWLVGDFSAIEARVIAWFSGEEWRMDVFRTHGKIYEASAAQMFKIPMESIAKDSKERQKGKVAELACGYNGGTRALEAMDPKWAATQTQEELKEVIDAWRAASPNIVQLWKDTELAAKEAIRYKTTVPLAHGVAFSFRNGNLYVKYPTGRETCYREAQLEWRQKFGQTREGITFMGVEEQHWVRLETYGGKLVENIVQGIARDCLMVAFTRLTRAGFDVRFRVHDELVSSGDPTRLKEMLDIMGLPILWAPGLPLPADGSVLDYYMKD